MVWSQLVEALLLTVAAAAVAGVWMSALRRDRQIAQALRRSEERFRQLTSLSADWFWETDAEHRISWLSGGSSVATLFGGELAHGKRLWEIPGVDVEPRALVEHFERLLRMDAQLPFFDFVISRSDGTEQSAHVVIGKPHYDAAGKFLGYRGVGQDITEQRRSQQALADAKKRLELATEVGNLAIWDIDLRDDGIHLGGGWAENFGNRHYARSADVLNELVHPEDRDSVRKAFIATLKAEPHAVELRLRTAAGAWKWMYCFGRVTERDAAGRGLRMTGTIVDVDARKRAEQASRESEERYRSLIDLAPDGVIVASGGVIEYANPAAVRLLKAGNAQRLLGTRTEQYIHPEHLGRFRERRSHLFGGPGRISFEERRFLAVDGSEVVVELAGVSYLERGRLVVQAVLRDVSAQREEREKLAQRERRFRDVLEASGEYVWETDAEWRYTFLSERVEAVLGYLRHEMIGKTPREFMPLGESMAMEDWFARRAADAKGFRDLVHRSLTKSGRVVWQSVNGVPVVDAAGKLAGYRGTGADITARTLAEDRIRFLATRDALTGLPNRVLLADRAGQAILSAARARGGLALLFIDLDRFKLVNDSLGHAAGDALLRAVAERLGAAAQRDDTLARSGGDEFVLLSGLEGSQDAAMLAERVKGVLARPFTVDGQSLNISASIGISVYPGDGRDFGELLKNAGTAASHAKQTGSDRFMFYSPELNARAVARLGMENDLHRALARGELLLHWQPVVARGMRIVGAEALLRWQHPRDGLLMPDRFIQVAEDSGLIRPLGQWTLKRALGQVGAWRRGSIGTAARALVENFCFSINVSAHELAQGDAYVSQVAAALAANEVPGSCIELEITERVLMSHLEENVETLRKLARHGLRIAIDDFGTGYSSLAYLRHLPIDKLKIDRSFLRELDAHPADATIVQTIAAMGKALGLRVAAEGVESEAQLARLQALGCEEWQGYHFSAPLDAADFERLFTNKIALTG